MLVPFVPGPLCVTRPCCRHTPSSVPACQTTTNLVPWLSWSGVIWRLVVAAIGRPFRAGFDLIYLVSQLLPGFWSRAAGQTRADPNQQTEGAPLCPPRLPGSPLPPLPPLPHTHPQAPLDCPDRAVTATRLGSRDKNARPVWFWSNPVGQRPSLFCPLPCPSRTATCACVCALARGRLHLTYMP